MLHMPTDTRTLAELITVLALTEVPCPSRGRDGEGGDAVQMWDIGWEETGSSLRPTCPTCSGTGHVPRFRDKDGKSLFKVLCPGRGTRVDGRATLTLHSGCCTTLWLPLPDADLHLEMLMDAVNLELPFITRLVMLDAYFLDGMLGAARALVAVLEAEA